MAEGIDCRPDEIAVVRRSGGEFAVLVPRVRDPQALATLARRSLDALARPFQVEGHEIHGGSLGLALSPDGSDVETLLKNADAAMYHAKELAGTASARSRTSWASAARTACAWRRRCAARSRRTSCSCTSSRSWTWPRARSRGGGAGALAGPERGLVMPAGFIPLAEESGLGHAVGQWVLEAACTAGARVARRAPSGDVAICVNLSAEQLRDAGLVARPEEAARAHRLRAPTGSSSRSPRPAWWRDVDSGATLERAARAGRAHRDRRLRHRLLVARYLRQLPVDALKIDRAFVAEHAERARGDRAIVRRSSASRAPWA